MKGRKHTTDSTPTAPPAYDWRLRSLSGNVAVDTDTTTLWFVMHPVRWNYRADAECEAEIAALTKVWTSLRGHAFHLRSLPLPYPVSAWARNLDLNTPHPVNPEAWRAYLAVKQGRLRGKNLGENLTMVGVQVDDGGALVDRVGATLFRKRDLATRVADRAAESIERITGLIAPAARPATQREVEWLLRQSHGLQLPTPLASNAAGNVDLDEFDLAGVFATVDVEPVPGQRAVRVFADHTYNGDTPVERYVSILCVGRMEAQDIPATAPWLAHALQFPGAEVSVHGRIITGDEAAKIIGRKIDLIQDQAPQYTKHGLIPPPNLARTLKSAVRVKDEMEEGTARSATRVECWARIAVSADSPEALRKRVTDITDHFNNRHIELEQPICQEGLYREFVPGEPLATTAHARRMRVDTWAASIPQVASRIGDRQGIHIGSTRGVVRTAVMWDLHRGMEQDDRTGLTPVIGGLGSGKSAFIGFLSAMSACRGIHTTVLDPAGQLARIVEWKPIAEHSAAVDLLRSDPGTLGPYSVIPEPALDDARQDPSVTRLPIDEQQEAAERLHEQNRLMAAIERKALAVDTLTACLPAGLATDKRTEVTLMQAVRHGAGKYTADLGADLLALKDMADEGDDHARVLWITLSEAAEHPNAQLFMSSGGYRSKAVPEDKTLLVITLGGIVLPKDGSNRSEWGLSERLAVPLVSLAAHYTSSRIYRRPRPERKVVAMDELHYLSQWPSGRSLLARLERESRRWNTRVLAASQDARTALSSQDASNALVEDAIVFAVSGADPGEQREALRLLQLPLGAGYESTLTSLRPTQTENATASTDKWRDALMRINGTVARVRPDYGDTPDLRDLLITTPTPPGVKIGMGVAEGEWFE